MSSDDVYHCSPSGRSFGGWEKNISACKSIIEKLRILRARALSCPVSGSGNRLTTSIEKPNSVTRMTTEARMPKRRRAASRQNVVAGFTLSESTASSGATAGNAASSDASGSSEKPMTNSVPISEYTARSRRSRSFTARSNDDNSGAIDENDRRNIQSE